MTNVIHFVFVYLCYLFSIAKFYILLTVHHVMMCITLVIYQESLHDARSTKCKMYLKLCIDYAPSSYLSIRIDIFHMMFHISSDPFLIQHSSFDFF